MKYFVDVTDGKVPPFYCDCWCLLGKRLQEDRRGVGT